MTEFVYQHQSTVETMSGEMKMTLRVKHLGGLNYDLVSAKCSIKSPFGGPDEEFTLPPLWFWALLEEDAKEIYDNCLEAAQDNTLEAVDPEQ